MGFYLNKISPALMERIVKSNPTKAATLKAAEQPLHDPLTPTPKYLAGQEKKLQQDCENYLRQHDLFYLRMPMHRATGIRLGWPDFAVFFANYQCALIEMKVEGGSVSEDQHKLYDEYQRQTGEHVFIVTSFVQFVDLVKTFEARTANEAP